MATYLQGVTDYIPNIQPWSPDLNFYQNVLERKQAKYDQGWENVNSVYNSILNAPMMRDQNIERRDTFFKNVEHQIKQMAGVDLSLQQNVDAATQVFKPFYEDGNIIKDIGFTKKYQDEMQRAEYFRTCTDRKKCGGQYWAGGVRAMNYRAQEFVDASDPDALGVQAPRYTPYVNFMEKATAAAKEADLNIEYDTKQGGYIVTTKNGPALTQPLMSFFMARFGDDPELQDFYGTKAYLLRKENPEAAVNAYEMVRMQSQAGSPEELEDMIAERTQRQNFDDASQVIDQTQQREESKFKMIITKKKVMENQMATTGIVKGGPEDRAYKQILTEEDAVRRGKDNLGETTSMIEGMSYIDENGQRLPVGAIDGVVANAMLMREMGMAAETLAYKDYSVKMKADPYALADYKNNLSLQKDYIKHEYRLQEIAVKDIMKAGKEHREMLIKKDYINPMTGMPRYIDPEKQTMEALPGGGMGIGDPADMAAMYRLNLLGQGAMPPSRNGGYASGASGYTRTNGQTRGLGGGESGYKGDVYMPPAYANMAHDRELPGFAEEDPSLAISFEGKDINPDTRVSEATQAMRDDEIDFIKYANRVDEVIQDIASWSQAMLNEAGNIQTGITRDRLSTLMTIAADESHPSHAQALMTMGSIGNLVKENKRENGAIFTDEALGLSRFQDFPSTSNAGNLDAAYFRNNLDMDIDNVILAAGGTRNLYEMFSTDQHKTITRAYDSDKMIDRNEVGLISADEYAKLANRSHDISAWKFIDDNIKRLGRGIYKEGDAGLEFHDNNPGGFSPLNEAEATALKEYEYYTTQPSFDNGLNDAGLNSTIPEIQVANIEERKLRGFAEWAYKGGTAMQENFVRHQTEVAEAFGAQYGPEGALFGTSESSVAEGVISRNIWDPEANGGFGGFTAADNIYNKVAEEGLNDLSATLYETNPGDFGSMYSFTVLELEDVYMGGRRATSDQGIKNLLAESEFLDAEFPEYDRSYESRLFQWVESPEVKASMSSKRIHGGESDLFDSPTGWMWGAILEHKDTKVTRSADGKKFSVQNAEWGINTGEYNLDDYEVYRGYENMYEAVHDNMGPMRADFMQASQQTTGKDPHDYFVLPSHMLGGSAGNFSFSGGSLTNVTVQSGMHNQAERETIPLMREILGKYNDNITAYGEGLIQGDEDLLNLVVTQFGDEAQEWKKDEKRPILHMDVDPVYGNVNLSRVTIELDPATAMNFMKSRGLTTYQPASGDVAGKHVSNIPMKGTYYIANAQSDIIQKTRPNPYTQLLGMSENESYVDDTYMKDYGSQMEFKRKGNMIEVVQSSRYWDPNSKDYVTIRSTPFSLPLHGTDWRKQISMYYDDIFETPAINANLMVNEEFITNKDQYQNQP